MELSGGGTRSVPPPLNSIAKISNAQFLTELPCRTVAIQLRTETFLWGGFTAPQKPPDQDG